MSESKLTKNQLLVKIDQLMASFKEQKRENNVMKENHYKQVNLYEQLINVKTNENENLMSMIKKHEKEIERIESTTKKHEYEYGERLKEKDRIHKREKEEREKTYKHKIELMQENINHLEQIISDLQSRINDNENVSTPELY
ncbi:4063_t:CDS:1 [Scutellospora calospora]|uniref:4063_t:CDS:1 n=1 Tax=Scutellospora calospora TaxID=85575 RepID=A0ACA9PCX8_9GLOM|nr:4063_t:CDS:1 [Scutellospora calospora]